MILQVEGHVDERGNEEYNLVLGHQRANSVKDLLKSYVADPATLQTVSFGEEFPAVPNPMNRLGVRTDEFNSPSYFVHDLNVPTAPISAAVGPLAISILLLLLICSVSVWTILISKILVWRKYKSSNKDVLRIFRKRTIFFNSLNNPNLFRWACSKICDPSQQRNRSAKTTYPVQYRESFRID